MECSQRFFAVGEPCWRAPSGFPPRCDTRKCLSGSLMSIGVERTPDIKGPFHAKSRWSVPALHSRVTHWRKVSSQEASTSSIALHRPHCSPASVANSLAARRCPPASVTDALAAGDVYHRLLLPADSLRRSNKFRYIYKSPYRGGGRGWRVGGARGGIDARVVGRG